MMQMKIDEGGIEMALGNFMNLKCGDEKDDSRLYQ